MKNIKHLHLLHPSENLSNIQRMELYIVIQMQSESIVKTLKITQITGTLIGSFIILCSSSVQTICR